MTGAPTTRTPSAWRQFCLLFIRDISLEMHSFDMLSSMGFYSVLVLVIFGAALAQSSSQVDILELSGGLMWTMIVFTSLLGLNRAFAAESEDGGLDGILLVPLDRSVIFLAKMASNLVFLLVVELIACPLFYFFFLSQTKPGATLVFSLLPLVVGSIGIAGVGTLLATITNSTRTRDVMLAILFVPLAYPLLYAVVAATTVAITGASNFDAVFVPSIALAAGYDVIMVSISWLLYPYVVAA